MGAEREREGKGDEGRERESHAELAPFATLSQPTQIVVRGGTGGRGAGSMQQTPQALEGTGSTCDQDGR